MFNEERYKKELKVLNSSKNFARSLPILNDILDEFYWTGVKQQLETLLKDPFGNINPVFNLILRKDKDAGFVKIKRLDDYLNLIFRRREVNQEQRNYIKEALLAVEEMRGLNIIYEVSVLGYILNQFSADRIQLYPKTTSKKNVDLKINFVERDIYIEVTALGESKFMRDGISDALKSGKIIAPLPDSDEEKDIRRIRSRLEEKEKQFMPQKPNVLIVFISSSGPESIPAFGFLKKAIDQDTLENIGLIMEFNRQNLIGLYRDGCDEKCFLTEEEEKNMKDLFSPDKFESLVYS